MIILLACVLYKFLNKTSWLALQCRIGFQPVFPDKPYKQDACVTFWEAYGTAKGDLSFNRIG